MYKCECCGKEGQFSNKMINGTAYNICSDCAKKIDDFRSKKISIDKVISEETDLELASILSGEASPVEENLQIKSSVGTAITVFSTIVFILCLIGSFVLIANDQVAVGLSAILCSVLFYLLCLGIATICHKLTSIDSKLK